MKNLIILVVVLAAVAGGYYVYQSRAPEAPAPQAAPAPTAPAPTSPGATHAVAITAGGFTPANITIKAGDTVVFRNDDSRTHWPASGVHPTHQLCPGLDALKPLANGETYSFTFREAKECPTHDHPNPNLRGKITVTQ